MRSPKRYTNQTFTKRVDHDAGSHRQARRHAEPAVCERCGNVYADRRWSRPEPAGPAATGSEKHPHFRPPKMVLCPACKQEQEGIPKGFLTLSGAFYRKHADEILRLLRNEAERAAEDNPLARIMGIKREGDKTQVTTTTNHLVQRLGHAIDKAYGGEITYDFSHENQLTRVYWKRE
jgi:hypothetical protein